MYTRVAASIGLTLNCLQRLSFQRSNPAYWTSNAISAYLNGTNHLVYKRLGGDGTAGQQEKELGAGKQPLDRVWPAYVVSVKLTH